MSVAWNQRRRNAAILAAVGAAVGASWASSAGAATTPYYWSDNNNDHKWETSNATFGSNWAPSPATIGTGTTMRGNATGDFPDSLNADAYFLAGNVNTNINLNGFTRTVNKLQFGTDTPNDPNFAGDTNKISNGTLNFNQIVSGAGVAQADPQVTGSGINTINALLVPINNGATTPTVTVNGGILTFNNSGNNLTGTTVTVNAGGIFAPTGGSPTVHESSFGASIHLNGGTFKAVAANAGTQTGQLTDYIFTNKDSVNASANAGLATGGINSLVAFAGNGGADFIRAANQAMTYDLARANITGNDGINGNTGPYSTATLGAQFKGGSQSNISTLTLGQLTVTSTGNTVYTFGSRSDDGSVVYIDLNKNGTFDSNELIVNNNFDQGYTNRTGNATLAAGTYNIALGWYQGTCCNDNGVEFRYGVGSGLGYNSSSMSVINPASPITNLAFSTTSGLLAGYNNTDLTVDDNSIVDISQGGSTNVRSVVLGSGKNLTVNGLGTLSVTPTSGSALAGGGTNTIIANSNMQLNGVISGTTLLKKQGGGKLILNANSPSFTGNWQVDAGTLTVKTDHALGSAAAGQTVIVNSGGQLQFSMPSGTTYGTNQAVSINGDGPGSTGALSGDQNNTFNGKVTLAGNSRITSSANTLILAGGVDMTASNFNLRVGGGGSVSIDTTPLSGGGNLRKTEGGSLNLHVANTYTGTTTMDGGTINADAANSFGTTTGQAGLVQINSGTVNAKISNSLAGKTVNVVGGGTLAIPAPFVGSDTRVDANAANISLGVNNIIASTILFNAGSGKTGSFTNPSTPATIPVDNNGLIRAQSGIGDMSNTTIAATPRITNLAFSGGVDHVFFKSPAQSDIDGNGINAVTVNAPANPTAPNFNQNVTFPITYDTNRIADTGQNGNNGAYSTAAARFRNVNPDSSNNKEANIEIGTTGVITVGKTGTYTFGTRSDDGSTLFIDLNNSGNFDASEMIVNNNNFQGYTNRIGTANLSATNAGPGGVGTYRIGVGFYQGGCCTSNGLEVRYGVGALTDYNQLSVVDPSNPITGGGARIQTDAGATLIVGATTGKPDAFLSGTLQYATKAAPTAHTLGGVNVQSQTAVIDLQTNNNVTADVLNVVNAANITKTGPGTLTVAQPVTLRGGKITASGGVTDLSSGVLTAAPVVPGLIETQLSGSFNTGAFTPSNTLKSGPLKGNETSPANFPDNTTFAYTGRVYVPDNGTAFDGQGTIAFAENFDDNVLLKIDGVTRLNNTSWNTPTGTGALSLAAGYHDFEVRFGEGGGGVGPNGGAPASTHWGDSSTQFPLIGFGMDATDPVDNNTANPDRELYVFPDNSLASDPTYGPLLNGNPLFTQYGGGTIQTDQGGTLLVAGTAGQLDGTLNGGTLQYTNAAAATADALGNLTVSNLATAANPATINIGSNHTVTAMSATLFGTLSVTGPGQMTITQGNVLGGQTGGLDVQGASTLTVTGLAVQGTLNNTGTGTLNVGTTNLSGGGTFVKNGSGATTLTNVNVASGQTGTLTAQAGSTLSATNVTVGGTLNTNGAGNINFTSTVAGAGTLANSAGNLTIAAAQNWSAGANFTNSGGAANLNTNAGAAATAGAAAVHNLSATVSGGTVTLGAPQDLKNLTVSGGTYNLNGKRTEVYAADATGRAAVEASLYQSIRNGTLTDSTAADPNAVGITDQAVDLHGDPMVLVKLTRLGDANLDNQVNFADLTLMSRNYNNNSGSATWDMADFNRDGNVNFTDLTIMSRNYNQSFSGSNLQALLAASGFSASFQSDVVQAFEGAAVPEPASIGLLGLGAVGLLARRRRRA